MEKLEYVELASKHPDFTHSIWGIKHIPTNECWQIDSFLNGGICSALRSVNTPKMEIAVVHKYFVFLQTSE